MFYHRHRTTSDLCKSVAKRDRIELPIDESLQAEGLRKTESETNTGAARCDDFKIVIVKEKDPKRVSTSLNLDREVIFKIERPGKRFPV